MATAATMNWDLSPNSRMNMAKKLVKNAPIRQPPTSSGRLTGISMPAPAKRKDSAKNNVRALVPINPASSQPPAADTAQLTIVASIIPPRTAGYLRQRRTEERRGGKE